MKDLCCRSTDNAAIARRTGPAAKAQQTAQVVRYRLVKRSRSRHIVPVMVFSKIRAAIKRNLRKLLRIHSRMQQPSDRRQHIFKVAAASRAKTRGK